VLTILALVTAQADAAILKWQAYRAPEIRPESADEQPASRPQARPQVESRLKSTKPASRKIQQLGGRDNTGEDVFADPFEDGEKPIKRAAQLEEPLPSPAVREAEPELEDTFPSVPTIERPASPAVDSNEPGKLSTEDDVFPDVPVPEMRREAPALPPEEPSPYLDAPTAPSPSDQQYDYQPYTTASDCRSEKADCADALAKLKSNTLDNIDLSIAVNGVEGQDFPCECAFGVGETFQGRNWSCVTYNWKASGLCHKPLYFEQVAVERYGHSAPTLVQDVLCGAHFFASIPALPYMMGLCPPDECQYSLGYYRPGNCAPYLIDPIPLSLRAGLFQAAAIAGGILIIP